MYDYKILHFQDGGRLFHFFGDRFWGLVGASVGIISVHQRVGVG